MSYAPYGEKTVTGPDIFHQKYTGQVDDGDEAGLLYYKARYYDPKLGRFISADSTIPDPAQTQSFNRYMYVMGNPVSFNDPTGFSGDSFGPSASGPAGGGSGYGSNPAPSGTGGGGRHGGSNNDFNDGSGRIINPIVGLSYGGGVVIYGTPDLIGDMNGNNSNNGHGGSNRDYYQNGLFPIFVGRNNANNNPSFSNLDFGGDFGLAAGQNFQNALGGQYYQFATGIINIAAGTAESTVDTALAFGAAATAGVAVTSVSYLASIEGQMLTGLVIGHIKNTYYNGWNQIYNDLPTNVSIALMENIPAVNLFMHGCLDGSTSGSAPNVSVWTRQEYNHIAQSYSGFIGWASGFTIAPSPFNINY